MEIISKRKRVHVEKYGLCFHWRGDEQGGFSFDCDKDGNIEVDEMNDAAYANYVMCLNGTHDVVPQGVYDYSYDYTQHPIGKCSCGREVHLDHYTNPCECGRDYDSNGNLLAPRSQWGEETGEYPSDILRIP